MQDRQRTIEKHLQARAAWSGGLAVALLLTACSHACAQVQPPATPGAPLPPSQALSEAAAPPARGTVTSKLLRYAQRTIERYDTNADGHLDDTEWSAMRGRPETVDLDGNGQITVDEFARYVADFGAGRRIRLATPRDSATEAGAAPVAAMPAAQDETAETDPTALARRRKLKFFAPLPAGVPSWFVERDTDGDAQLTLAEYSPRLRTTEIAEFNKHDVNGDGLVTVAELSRAAAGTAPAASGSSPGVTGGPQ